MDEAAADIPAGILLIEFDRPRVVLEAPLEILGFEPALAAHLVQPRQSGRHQIAQSSSEIAPGRSLRSRLSSAREIKYPAAPQRRPVVDSGDSISSEPMTAASSAKMIQRPLRPNDLRRGSAARLIVKARRNWKTMLIDAIDSLHS